MRADRRPPAGTRTTGTPAAGDLTSVPPDGGAARAWALMQRFVESHGRHGELAQTLGFRLGAGRGKVLFGLRGGPMTLSEVAAANGVDAPYATLIVDKLESHGLVERRPHPDDRRRRLVSLTPAGRRAVTTAEAILLRPPPALGSLRPDEVRQLTGLLERLAAADGPDPTGDGVGRRS